MRAAGIFVIFAIACLASAQSPEEEEYQRKLKEYEEKKAVYDRHQAVASVPVKASNDLVPKVSADQIPPGYAEQLLPTYTGIPVQFHTLDGPVVDPEIVAETPTVPPPAQRPPNPSVRATPLRPGPQSLKPASSNVSVKTTIQAPGRVPVATRATITQTPTATRRPPGLFLFSNARLSFPSLVQRFGFGAAPAPLPTRVQVETFAPRRP